jgi:hypothetical protein
MPPASAAVPALSPATITALQEALNRQGAAIKVDGIAGPNTREAIRAFQSQHHLPVTGEPDRATLEKLGVTDRGGAQSGAAQPRMEVMRGQATPRGGTAPGGMMQHGMMQGGMMGGSMMERCHAMHKEMQSMMMAMQDMMKTMQSHMQQPPKSN